MNFKLREKLQKQDKEPVTLSPIHDSATARDALCCGSLPLVSTQPYSWLSHCAGRTPLWEPPSSLLRVECACLC